MRTLKISTYLAADLERYKSYLMTPILYYVSGWFNEIILSNQISFRQNGFGKFSVRKWHFI